MLCSLHQLSSGHKKHPEVLILSASIKICVKQLSKRAFLFNPPIKCGAPEGGANGDHFDAPASGSFQSSDYFLLGSVETISLNTGKLAMSSFL